MDIMELIMETCLFANRRTDDQMKQAYNQIKARIQAMQEVVDAVEKGDMAKYDYDLIQAMLKYKEAIKE